jgi:hypothetical protein
LKGCQSFFDAFVLDYPYQKPLLRFSMVEYERRRNAMPFLLFQGDITQMQVDAVVNAANRELQQGGGVCGAIFNGAGASSMQKACDELAPVEIGEVAITLAFKLPS